MKYIWHKESEMLEFDASHNDEDQQSPMEYFLEKHYKKAILFKLLQTCKNNPCRIGVTIKTPRLWR